MFNIYKYRRQSNRIESVLMDTLDSNQFSNISGSNLYHEIDKDNKQKTYAILQEKRYEFRNSKLKSMLLIYSKPAWNIFVLNSLFLAFFIDTCLYTFYTSDQRPLWLIILLIFLNLVFTCDVSIIAGLKFSKKWRKTLNLVEPDTYKVVLDVFLAVPYTVLYLFSNNIIPYGFHIVSPLSATLRIYRIIKYFYERSSQAGSNQWTSFLFQYLILFFLSVHTWTCVWFLFANKTFEVSLIPSSWAHSAIYLPTEDTIDWYFVCCYWSVMFLTTNALGDLYPVTTIERITAILATLLGFLLTTVVFVGSLTSQFINITTRRSIYVRRLQKIRNHLKRIQMDTDTTKRIIRYI